VQQACIRSQLHLAAVRIRAQLDHSQWPASASNRDRFCRRLTRFSRIAFAAHSTCVSKKTTAPSKA